jgi:hypothetical protein
MGAVGAHIAAPDGSDEALSTFLNELREPQEAAEADVSSLVERMEQARPSSP